MKFHPTTPGNPQREKSKYNKYCVIIGGCNYETSALTNKAAISKAAYKFSQDTGESVGLVQWKIREGKLYSNVEKV